MASSVTWPTRAAVVGFGSSGRVFHAPFFVTDPADSLDVIGTPLATDADMARPLLEAFRPDRFHADEELREGAVYAWAHVPRALPQGFCEGKS
ncbi:hypothetical protein FM104_01070 [Microbacterium esteraromaticum]|uniref:Oxidoreductase n=1 Tax=Microbacterium esteraromaticum TaxID=57043 RepID=A0A1R4IBS4_9MICO|nr:hypothetical protein [Microbacterium esteraromaticum]SJN16743.1 hypothetical protein FM104_01070 [Microbacterium esteraromaticum]